MVQESTCLLVLVLSFVSLSQEQTQKTASASTVLSSTLMSNANTSEHNPSGGWNASNSGKTTVLVESPKTRLMAFPTGPSKTVNKSPINTPLSFPMGDITRNANYPIPTRSYSPKVQLLNIRKASVISGPRLLAFPRVNARKRNHLATASRPIVPLSSPMEVNQGSNTASQSDSVHPDYNCKYYLLDIILERPSRTSDTTFEVLQSINTIFRNMEINDMVSEDAFKILGKPWVILVLKGKMGSMDITGSMGRVVRSLERLGTKVDVTLLYSMEAFVESMASKLIPLSSLVKATRAQIPSLNFYNLYMCRVSFKGGDMDKLTYISQTLNVTLEMLAKRAAGQLQFKGHRIAGTQPFEFQFYSHQEPLQNELSAINVIPLLHAGNVQMKTEEVEPLDRVLETMMNTQEVKIQKPI